MDNAWRKTFRDRMHHFEARRSARPGELSVSIKVRVASGCFHREHSPLAYALIDRHLDALSPPDAEFSLEEHESGPEILAYLALTTAGLTVAKSVIDLVTAIIKARSEGVKKGDKPAEPVELIVRRIHDADEFREEIVVRYGRDDRIDPKVIDERLNEALRKLAQKKKTKAKKTKS